MARNGLLFWGMGYSGVLIILWGMDYTRFRGPPKSGHGFGYAKPQNNQFFPGKTCYYPSLEKTLAQVHERVFNTHPSL